MLPSRFVYARVAVASALLLLAGAGGYAQNDPLPSWNDGAAKQAILAFVETTTDPASPRFVPPAERIATFDQDGTLWVEHPMYTQVMYCPRARAGAREGPAGARQTSSRSRPCSPATAKPSSKLSTADLEKILAATLAGMTVDAFGAQRQEVDGDGQGSALEASLHRAHVPADAGAPEVPARQRLQDLHRHRRRPGLRARLRRRGLRHSARAGGRHRRRHEIRLRRARKARS